MKNIIFLILLGWISFSVSSQEPVKISPDLELIRISENAYIHVSYSTLPGYGRVSANGLIFTSEKSAILFDTPWNDSLTAALVLYLRDTLELQIEGFVPNHWHEDCMGGLNYLKSQKIRSYANQITIDITKKKGLPVPEVGFTDSLELRLGDKSINCYYPGPAHSLDNIVVWIPSEKILFPGCICKSPDTQNLGNTSDGDLSEYPATIDKIIRKFKSAQLVIPGHGTFGGPELLAHTRSLAAPNIKDHVNVAYLTGDFLNYFELSKNLSDELKIKYFETEVYNKAPSIYENIYNDIKWIGQEPDKRILRFTDEFKNIEESFMELNGKLYDQFDSSLAVFRDSFPDFKPDFDVCILHSLGIRAGGPVKIQDRTVLMFGVDQMARYFNFQNFNPFFQHELAHIYHSQHFAPVDSGIYSKDAIYNYLWREGLAVYISSVLNPDAREIEIFMTDNLKEQSDKIIGIIAREMVDNLYSTEKAIIEKYFWKSSKDTLVPPTAGYYLGYLMVKEIAKEYTLTEIVNLDEKLFIPRFERILKSL